MVDPSSELERARAAYGRQAWREAYEALSRADAREPLGPDDRWRLAMSAALLGRDPDFLAALERAHQAHLEAEEPVAAARCAFWLGLRLAFTGEMGPAGDWFGRAGRLLELADVERRGGRSRRSGPRAAHGGRDRRLTDDRPGSSRATPPGRPGPVPIRTSGP